MATIDQQEHDTASEIAQEVEGFGIEVKFDFGVNGYELWGDGELWNSGMSIDDIRSWYENYT